MTQLEHDMNVLHRLFEPWLTAPQDTVIWAVEESDPNAHIKHDLIAKANQVLAAGDNALIGARFEVPQFSESAFSAIAEALATDPEERDFFELAEACKRVAQSLAQIAT